MRAVVFDRFGPPDVLQLVERPDPQPGPGDVVVRVEAASVARLDVFARAGRLPGIALPRVPGGEHAGVVEAVGVDVHDLAVGARVVVFPVLTCGDCRWCRGGRAESCPTRVVLGVHADGSYAELTAVPRTHVREIPDELSAADAAAAAMSGTLAHHQLAEAGAQPNDWVLVQAAGGGLGAVSALLGVHLGMRVIATSRTPQKRARLERLGVVAALDATDHPGFVDAVMELTGGAGVTAALDSVGDPRTFERTLAVLGRTGAVVLAGAGLRDPAADRDDGAGDGALAHSPRLDLARLYVLSQRISALSTSHVERFHAFWPLVEAGFRAPLDRSFPLAEAAAAHERLERNENFGRVTLAP
ncbi:MAG TPA: alcohol dehydrogenase catalytic domain-containing protein [Conexibacter sp.]|nr:alcohol dehydrogenase catalytic domain-containing protein [Conexibacter sp.]